MENLIAKSVFGTKNHLIPPDAKRETYFDPANAISRYDTLKQRGYILADRIENICGMTKYIIYYWEPR